jgi:hypothetical protein
MLVGPISDQQLEAGPHERSRRVGSQRMVKIAQALQHPGFVTTQFGVPRRKKPPCTL